jgi:hypothetical protein
VTIEHIRCSNYNYYTTLELHCNWCAIIDVIQSNHMARAGFCRDSGATLELRNFLLLLFATMRYWVAKSMTVKMCGTNENMKTSV